MSEGHKINADTLLCFIMVVARGLPDEALQRMPVKFQVEVCAAMFAIGVFDRDSARSYLQALGFPG